MSLKNDGIDTTMQKKVLDAVEAVQKGEEGADERLKQYYEAGWVYPESFNKLISEYPIARAKRIAEEKRKADKKKKILICSALLILAVIILFVISAFAHSGRTDASGGHRDNNNVSGLGYYHYHCGGNPPHLHSNGTCPYSHKNSISNAQIINPPTTIHSTNGGGYSDEYGEEYDLGYEDGHESGYEEGYNEGKKDGHDEGYDEGYEKGYEEGYDAKQEQQEELDDQNKKVVLSVGVTIAALWALSKTIRHNK